MVVLTIGTGAWLWLDRAGTLRTGERSAHALARVLEEQTARGLQAVDLTLTGVIDALSLSPGIGDHNPAFEDTLRERLRSLPLVRALYVIGPDGFIVQDTDPDTPHVTLADRDYFIAHAADPSPAIRIGKPLISRSVGVWFISVSRRITRSDGSFGGIAVAAVEPRYFERFYRELDLGESDRIGLFRRDGILLVGTPYNDEAIGKDYSAMDLFQVHLPGKADGVYRIHSMFDQTPRIISYRAITGFPLVVTVALAEDNLLAGWRRNAAVIVVAAGLVAILIILLASLWDRRQAEWERARQHQIEARKQSVQAALKMAAVLESTTDSVVEMDHDWRITFMNERAKSSFVERGDLVGRSFWDAYPELVGSDVWSRCHQAMDADGASEFEITGPLAGRWYFARAFPSRDGLAIFFQDVTARRQAEQERERLAQELERERTLLKGVLAHLPSGVFAAAAPEGRLLLHNAAAERLIGHPVRVAQSVDDYVAHGAIHPDGSPYRPDEYPLARALLHGQTIVQEEMIYRRGDGTLTTFAVSAAPVRSPDGRTVMAVSIFHDISERKRMEEDLRTAKQAAERTSLSKSKFLAAASHDLRQPLQSLFLFAAALHGHVQTERGRGVLETLERNLAVLKGLLDSLLDVSRLDTEVIRPTIEDFLLAPMLDDISASFMSVAVSRGLDFIADIPRDVTVRSDRHLLGRMIRNLVENAIKYTEQGSIGMECRVVGDHVRIVVYDTGIGIAPDQQEAIFVEFHQIGNPARDRTKGLGLGLSIVQRLAKLLDHPVSVQSMSGQGSVFTVDVPLGKLEAVRSPEPFTAVAPGGAGCLAVLIDDESDVLLGLRSIFRDWGYDTVAGTSAEQALEQLKADGRTPAVIVSDYRLGENHTGVEAVRLVRELVGAAVPGVVLTGETGWDLRAEVAGQGLEIVIKPVAPRQLHEAIKRLLGEPV